MQELIQYLKKEQEKKSEWKRDLFDYTRAIIGTIHLAGATVTGSLAWPLEAILFKY